MSESVLSPNQKISVRREGERSSFEGQIWEVYNKEFAIPVPSAAGQYLTLYAGENVEIQVVSKHERYVFVTRVVSRKQDKIPLYVLALPAKMERVQLRGYVRIKCALEVAYQEVLPGEMEFGHLTGPQRRGTTVDLSGGGLQMLTKDKVEQKAVVVQMTFKDKNDEEQAVSAMGKVKRCQAVDVDGLKRFLVGVSFDKINERERDKIISFIFKKMADQSRVKDSDKGARK